MSLAQILGRLRDESLNGPSSPFSPANGANARRLAGSKDDWVHVDGQQPDVDSKDPRWLDLFIEHFLTSSASTNDDLLFFVRAQPALQTDDPIFVRRKVGTAMPHLNELVDWKSTFFINLIVQLPCTLTVAVCKRSVGGGGEVKKKPLLNPSSSETIVDATSSSTPSLPKTPPTPRSRMIALRRTSKKVYAAPYKSRMDVKDAFMNEQSWPLVYYTVNDYESADLHLSIGQREYLCVELSVVLSRADGHGPAVETIDEDDDAPFPVPRGCHKIVLFQGAVPYSSLIDIFMQKHGPSAPLPPPPAKMKTMGSSGSLNTVSPPDEKTEYVMMRGPHGKGQCQVAIREFMDPAKPPPPIDAGKDDARSDSLTTGGTISSLLKVVRYGIAAVAGGGGTGNQSNSNSKPMRKPDLLRCSMTYVNVPWQSIISDLMAHTDALLTTIIPPDTKARGGESAAEHSEVSSSS